MREPTGNSNHGGRGVKVFVDFDGTITRRDVGDAVFEEFGGKKCIEILEDFRNGTISAVECYERESAACGRVDQVLLDEFLDGQAIDSTFVDFVQFCRVQGFGCCILSDGLDYYINRILRCYGLGTVEFFANTLTLKPVDGPSTVELQLSYPYADEVCDRCACCKRNHMLTRSGDDEIIVYVGEGYSDRCPIRFADIVFAKDDLLKYCQLEKISCHEYQCFSDVRDRLLRMLSENNGRNGLRPRRQTVLARRRVFMGE